jgi:hypothetical protein
VPSSLSLRFVMQRHDARRLHAFVQVSMYSFRTIHLR